MKVIGIGLNKTGTTTLGVCLQRLGYRHTSFDLDLLRAVASGDPDPALARLEAHDSAEDWPWPLLFREIDAAFPGSRFVLTLRREGATWHDSLCRHAERTGPAEARRLVYGHEMPHEHEAEDIAYYHAHTQAVRHHFADRPGQLLELCWERGDGWDELCTFLGHPVPDEPLPHVNARPPRGIARLLRHMPRVRRWLTGRRGA